MKAMPSTTPAVQAALRDARQQLQAHYGDRLRRVVLFGSQARGTAHEDSDVDVLVVLADPVRSWDELGFLAPLKLNLLDEHGVFVQFVPFPESRYHDAAHPLMMNVHAEGVPV